MGKQALGSCGRQASGHLGAWSIQSKSYSEGNTMRLSWRVAVSFIGLASAGCTATKTPILAVAADNVGITAGVGAQNQGGDLTVGYKGAKFAVVPVQTSGGQRLTLYNGDSQHEKSFSVFAALGVDRNAGLYSNVDLRQVVAVGPAAEIWAAGSSGATPEEINAAINAGIIQRW